MCDLVETIKLQCAENMDKGEWYDLLTTILDNEMNSCPVCACFEKRMYQYRAKVGKLKGTIWTIIQRACRDVTAESYLRHVNMPNHNSNRKERWNLCSDFMMLMEHKSKLGPAPEVSMFLLSKDDKMMRSMLQYMRMLCWDSSLVERAERMLSGPAGGQWHDKYSSQLLSTIKGMKRDARVQQWSKIACTSYGDDGSNVLRPHINSNGFSRAEMVSIMMFIPVQSVPRMLVARGL